MELRKFKEKNPKKVGIIVFTITCILLITGVILYRTFAIFQVDTTQNVINGSIEDPGDIYFAFYKDGNIQKEMPKKSDGYILDEQESSCGVNGTNADSIKVSMTEDEVIHVSGVATSRTKCNLYFVKGAYILGKGIPFETESDGLYEVKHDGVTGTINDSGFQKTEYRYAGQNPDNYIKFNNETWRIIGLVNVMTSETNVEQRVKIVKNENMEERKWDDNYKNDWTKSTLNTYLNEEYYNKLNNNAQSIIDENIIWNIGSTSLYQEALINNWYSYERGTIVANGNQATWKGKIGLIYPSDYGYATNGGKIVRKSCFEKITLNWNEIPECASNNYLTSNKTIWTMIAPYTYTNAAYNIMTNGSIVIGDGHTINLFIVMPALYLKPTVKISKGSGKNTDAFTLNYEIN